jgi:hypothetical protein
LKIDYRKGSGYNIWGISSDKWRGEGVGGGGWVEKIRGWGRENECMKERDRIRSSCFTKTEEGIVYRYKPTNQKLASPLLPHTQLQPVATLVFAWQWVTIEFN